MGDYEDYLTPLLLLLLGAETAAARAAPGASAARAPRV